MLDIEELLNVLHNAEVQFVVIGGVAAVSHGSAHITGDLNVCFERAPVNCERIVEALAPLHPTLRGAPPDLPFQWDTATLKNDSNFTLSTDAGPLDLRGHVSGLGSYAEVEAQAVTLESCTTARRRCSASKASSARKKPRGAPRMSACCRSCATSRCSAINKPKAACSLESRRAMSRARRLFVSRPDGRVRLSGVIISYALR